MADVETFNAASESRPKGFSTRWLVSLVLIVALTGVTIAAMRWNQSIRTFLDGYLDGHVAQDVPFGQEEILNGNQEVPDPTELSQPEIADEIDSPTQDAVGVQNVLSEPVVSAPIPVPARDPFSEPDPVGAVRIDLNAALAFVASDVDLDLVTETLQRALAIASRNHMSATVTAPLEQALTEIDQLRRLDFALIRGKIDDISKSVISLKSERPPNGSAVEHDSTFSISEPPESQSFWRELTDEVTDVYHIRRIDEPTSPDIDVNLEQGDVLRLLVLLERARSDMRVLGFDSYRASLNEAITILDSLGREDASEWEALRVELLELLNLELTSPRRTIRTALSALTNETLLPGDEAAVSER